MLYSLVQCPKRVELDLFGNPAKRDEVNAFVQMLWDRGTLYEQQVMDAGNMVALDLSKLESGEKQRGTLEAMGRLEPTQRVYAFTENRHMLP